MIHAQELCKSYDKIPALQDVTFSVQEGEVIGLLGPNGAGKTTLMKILTGYLHPTSGSAQVAGFDILDQSREIQANIGYLPENAPLYPELTVQSYLTMIADLRKIPKTEQLDNLSETISSVGLEDRLTRPIGTLSKGYRQRVGLAQAILHRPKLLILDEPTNGLDPTQIVHVRTLIKKLAKQSTVVISTHILSEVEATCDRALIIINGKLQADAKLSELAASSKARLILETDDPEIARSKLKNLAGVTHVSCEQDDERHVAYFIENSSNRDLCPEIYQLARNEDWQLCELRREVRTLEAVFNTLVQEGGEL
ncbi:MAG: ABC transporter ATP-binding protein [Desulfobulbaceae bacterium]|nr:ABC transporter ATP-binding protein [Desulfobulbaceae bacterium]